MFGLIVLAGLVFMTVCLVAAVASIFVICRVLRIPIVVAVTVSLAIPVGALLAANVAEIQSTREFNALCQVKSSRRVLKTVQDVEAVKVRGDVYSFYMWGAGDKYGYVEWEAPPLKWRSNRRSSAICGPNRACNVEEFTARYELQILSDSIDSHIKRLQIRIVDSATHAVLATDEGFTLNLSQEKMSVESLFLMPWQFPRDLVATPVEGCTLSDPKGFIDSVLVPRATRGTP